MLVGGSPTTTPVADVWEFDGQNWLSVSTTGAVPSSRHSTSLVYDDRRGDRYYYDRYDRDRLSPPSP